MFDALLDVCLRVRRLVAFRLCDFDVINLQQCHQIPGRWSAVDRSPIAVLEQHREHPDVVDMGMGDYYGVEIVQWQHLGCSEERLDLAAISCRLGAAVYQYLGLVRGYQMHGPADLPVGTQCSDTDPWLAWTLSSVYPGTELSEQGLPLVGQLLSIAADVMLGPTLYRWSPDDIHQPTYLISEGADVRAFPTDGGRWIIAL